MILHTETKEKGKLMNRLFVRRNDEKALKSREEFPLTKINVAVTGLGRSVGTTFVSSSLAFFFSEKGYDVSFTECAEPRRVNRLLYDAVSMDKRFINRSFTDVYDFIDREQTLKKRGNIEEGISWTLITPKDCEKGIRLDAEKRGRLVHSARGQICVFDVEAHSDWNVLLLDMDLIVAVVDPLPSKMIKSAERFRRLRKMEIDGNDLKWLVNRTNAGISRKEVKRYLKSESVFWLDNFPAEEIYRAEYASEFYYAASPISEVLRHKFEEILRKGPVGKDLL